MLVEEIPARVAPVEEPLVKAHSAQEVPAMEVSVRERPVTLHSVEERLPEASPHS